MHVLAAVLLLVGIVRLAPAAWWKSGNARAGNRDAFWHRVDLLWSCCSSLVYVLR